MTTGLKAKRRNKRRPQLGAIITHKMKKRIEVMARKSGQSQGQVAEQLMLEAFTYRDQVAAIRKGIEEIHKGNVASELYRLGYTRVRTTDASGKVFSNWFEPGHPHAPERSDFTPNAGDRRSIEIREHEDGTTEVITGDGGAEGTPKP